MRRGPRTSPKLLILALCGLCGPLLGCGEDIPVESPALDLGTLDESDDPTSSTERITIEGTDDPPAGTPGTDGPDPAEPPPAEEARSPENLAASVLDTVATAFQELGRLLESDDDLEAVRTGWADIKGRTTRSLKELARLRLRLDPKGRAAMRKLVMEGRPAALSPHFKHVEQGVRRFEKKDVALTTEFVRAHDLVELAFGG